MLRYLYFRFGGRITAECGHPARRRDRVSAFGENRSLTIMPPFGKAPEYCHACLEKMAVCCAWCGQSIFIGDPVTLYSPRDPNYRPKDGSHKHQDNPIQYAGCLRMNCAQSGSDRSGFWVPPGRVHRVPSPLEIAFATGKPVIVGALDDMRRGASLLE